MRGNGGTRATRLFRVHRYSGLAASPVSNHNRTAAEAGSTNRVRRVWNAALWDVRVGVVPAVIRRDRVLVAGSRDTCRIFCVPLPPPYLRMQSVTSASHQWSL